MKIAGITRVRNESAIIQDTLDHFAQFCNAGLYIYDDKSEDATPDICEAHSAVKAVIRGTEWDLNRPRAEYTTRQTVLARAQEENPDWFVYFDADERIEFDKLPSNWHTFDGVVMKLFDFYITPEDVDLTYNERKWLGPEFRRILMMFKNNDYIKYNRMDQREVTLKPGSRLLNAGYVKHYGKAISVEEWEKTCDYYAEHFPPNYKAKWLARKGKAVHTDMKSDFGRPLITWDEKDSKGIEIRK